MTLLVLILLAGLLFGLVFITKRRFGVLGLALCAGVLLNDQVSGYATTLLERYDVTAFSLSPASLAACALILLPSLLLLVNGPRYATLRTTIIGGILYAVFGLFLMLGPLTASLPFDSTVSQIMSYASQLNTPILTAGVVLALLDMMLSQAPKLHKDKEK